MASQMNFEKITVNALKKSLKKTNNSDHFYKKSKLRMMNDLNQE